jgi:hypothetical protein
MLCVMARPRWQTLWIADGYAAQQIDEHDMVSPSTILLELLLLAVVIALLRKQDKSAHQQFVLGFDGLTLVLSILFYYYIAAWPLYLSYGQSEGSPRRPFTCWCGSTSSSGRD